jgi:uncharacterized protein YkwD
MPGTLIRRLPILLFPSLLLLGACNPAPKPAADTGRQLYASLAAQGAQVDAPGLQSIINGYRQNLGLPPLRLDPALTAFAGDQVRMVAGASSLAIPGGKKLAARLREAGITAGTARENVSAGYYSISDAFSGWRGSKPNDETLRLPEGRRMGVATMPVPGSKYGVYWVLVVASD